jgi:glucokinase
MVMDATGETAIGADLGGTKVAVGAVSGELGLLTRTTRPTLGLGLEELLSLLTAELRAALDANPEASAVGLGIAGTLDRRRGMVVNAVNLPLNDVPIRDVLSEQFDLPVFLDNDANVAALAEHRLGAARDAHNAVVVTVGTGIGGGLILDGELFRGRSGAAPELGHVVIDADGPQCQGSCPNRGCVEAMASGTALAQEGLRIAEANPRSALGRALADAETIDGRRVVAAALAGDAPAREAVRLVGSRLGVALAGFANLFEPDVFVIGGGIAAAGELLIEPAAAEMRSRALPPQNRARVVQAELGWQAGLIGAATMALEEAGATTLEPVHTQELNRFEADFLY